MKLLRIVFLVFRMARVGNLFQMVTMPPVEPVAWSFFNTRNLMNPRDERSLPRG